MKNQCQGQRNSLTVLSGEENYVRKFVLVELNYSQSKGLFIPSKSEEDQRTTKKSKNKRQTSKKIFAFVFAFARSEHSLTIKMVTNHRTDNPRSSSRIHSPEIRYL